MPSTFIHYNLIFICSFAFSCDLFTKKIIKKKKKSSLNPKCLEKTKMQTKDQITECVNIIKANIL